MTTIAGIKIDLELMSAKFNRQAKAANKSLLGMRTGATALRSALATMVPVAGTAGLTLLVKNSIEAQASLFDLSTRLGASTEALSQLQYAAEQTGVSTNTLNMGIQRMVRRVSEAANGTGEAVKALDELGVSAIALEQLAPEQQFAVLADRIMEVKNPADQVRLAMKLFDSEGVALIQTMQGGSEQLKNFADEADNLGRTVSGTAAAEAKAASDSFARMGASATGVANALAVQLGPELSETADWLATTIPEAASTVRRWFNLVAAGALGLTKAMVDARIKWNELTRDFEEAAELQTVSDNLAGAQELLFEQAAALEKGAGSARQYAAEITNAGYAVQNMNVALGAGDSNKDNALEEFDLEKIRKLKKDTETVEQDHIKRILQINVSGNEKLTRAMRAAEAVKALMHARSAITMAWASAPFPANLPAVAITTAETMANVAAIRGAAHGGLTNVPSESTFLLQKGERVLSPNQNRDFTQAMRNGGVGGRSEVHNHYTLNVTAMDAGSFDDYVMANRGSIASAFNATREDRGESPI